MRLISVKVIHRGIVRTDIRVEQTTDARQKSSKFKNDMVETSAYEIFPLGDRALTVSFGNRISRSINDAVLANVYRIKEHGFPGLRELVPAYSSFSVFYDLAEIKPHLQPGKTAFIYVREHIEQLLNTGISAVTEKSRLVRIPVCYDPSLAPDLESYLQQQHLNIEELISLHTGKVYRVYMLGFLPGFAYMGEVDPRLQVPRKARPLPARAGSVGIAGVQTGIYPFASPGGWTIIGNSPVQLFSKHKQSPTLLQAGDQVQFFAIDKYEFAHY